MNTNGELNERGFTWGDMDALLNRLAEEEKAEEENQPDPVDYMHTM